MNIAVGNCLTVFCFLMSIEATAQSVIVNTEKINLATSSASIFANQGAPAYAINTIITRRPE